MKHHASIYAVLFAFFFAAAPVSAAAERKNLSGYWVGTGELVAWNGKKSRCKEIQIQLSDSKHSFGRSGTRFWCEGGGWDAYAGSFDRIGDELYLNGRYAGSIRDGEMIAGLNWWGTEYSYHIKMLSPTMIRYVEKYHFGAAPDVVTFTLHLKGE